MSGIVPRVCHCEACFPLGEFVRANREKSNLIGWRQTLTTSPPNHICFLLVRAKKIAKLNACASRKYFCTDGRPPPPPSPNLVLPTLPTHLSYCHVGEHTDPRKPRIQIDLQNTPHYTTFPFLSSTFSNSSAFTFRLLPRVRSSETRRSQKTQTEQASHAKSEITSPP